MKYAYPCNIDLDEEELGESGREAYVVNFPDLPEAITGGWSWDEAVEMAEDVLGLCLAHYCTHLGQIPTPSPPAEGQVVIPVPPLVAAKLTVYTAMREQGMTTRALAEKLGLTEEAVGKLLDPAYRTHFSQVEKALRAVGRSLVVEDAPVAKPALAPVAS